MMSESAKHAKHVWAGPDSDETEPSVIPSQQALAKSAEATIRVLELRRYSNGTTIEVEASAVTADSDPGEALRKGMETSGDDAEPPPAVLRFSVLLSDGATASTLDHPIVPSQAPAQPYLSSLGGPGYSITGGQLYSKQMLWLWPNPAGDAFELAAEWPLFNISATSTIDIRDR